MGFHVSLGERILPHLFDLKKQLVSSLQNFVPCRLYNSPFSGDPDDISMNTFPRLTWNLKMGLGRLLPVLKYACMGFHVSVGQVLPMKGVRLFRTVLITNPQSPI